MRRAPSSVWNDYVNYLGLLVLIVIESLLIFTALSFPVDSKIILAIHNSSLFAIPVYIIILLILQKKKGFTAAFFLATFATICYSLFFLWFGLLISFSLNLSI